MLPAKAGFKFKSKIPDFERGKAKILTTGIHWVFWGLKFEPVDKSRSSGTQKLGKRGRFAKVSICGHDTRYHGECGSEWQGAVSIVIASFFDRIYRVLRIKLNDKALWVLLLRVPRILKLEAIHIRLGKQMKNERTCLYKAYLELCDTFEKEIKNKYYLGTMHEVITIKNNWGGQKWAKMKAWRQHVTRCRIG